MSVSTPRLHFKENGIYATIETDNLYLRSIEADDINNCFALYSNQEVMKNYLDGTTKNMQYTVERVTTLAQRWRDGDPFSGFAVFVKEGGLQKFAGLAVLSHGDHPGEASLTELGDVQYWQKGYGKEAAEAIVHNFAPILAADKYLVGRTQTEAGQPLKKIVATCRTTNLATIQILDGIGMTYLKTELTKGASQNYYEYNLLQPSRRMCVLL